MAFLKTLFFDHPQGCTFFLTRRNKIKVLQKHSSAAFAKNNQILVKMLANTTDDKTCFKSGTSEVLNVALHLCIGLENTHVER